MALEMADGEPPHMDLPPLKVRYNTIFDDLKIRHCL